MYNMVITHQSIFTYTQVVKLFMYNVRELRDINISSVYMHHFSFSFIYYYYYGGDEYDCMR